MLPESSSGQAAFFPGQRTGEFVNVGFFCVGEGMVQESAACLAGQREALCPALKVFIVISVFKYGGARRWEGL